MYKSEVLKKAKEEQKVTYAVISTTTGLSTSTCRAYIEGFIVHPNLRKLARIAAVLGLTLDDVGVSIEGFTEDLKLMGLNLKNKKGEAIPA